MKGQHVLQIRLVIYKNGKFVFSNVPTSHTVFSKWFLFNYQVCPWSPLKRHICSVCRNKVSGAVLEPIYYFSNRRDVLSSRRKWLQSAQSRQQPFGISLGS